MIIHTVTPHESLEGIAARYHVSVSKLIEDNGLSAPYGLLVGQTLCIPLPFRFHTVSGGETEKEIADLYQTDIDTLRQLNPAFCQSGALYPGQVISVAAEERMPATVIGYISKPLPISAFSALLPYLTFIVIAPSVRAEPAARYAVEAKKRGVSPLYEGQPCEALASLLDGTFVRENEGCHFILKQGRDSARYLFGKHAEEKEGSLLSLTRPLLFKGEPAPQVLLPKLLNFLKREGGKIERDKTGSATFSYVERRRERAEKAEVTFCDAKKEKALLEENLREGFRSYIIWDEAEWSVQARLLFGSLFSPVKAVKPE